MSDDLRRAALPGDWTDGEMAARRVRAAHASAFGAERLRAGQGAVLGGEAVQAQRALDAARLRTAAGSVAAMRVRPTALLPVWQVAGYALGVLTGALQRAGADGLAGALTARAGRLARRVSETL